MNPLTPYLTYIKIGAAIALVLALFAAKHYYDQGIRDKEIAVCEVARKDANAEADKKIIELNATVKTQQDQLNTAALKIANQGTELKNVQAESKNYQSQLAAGTKRLRVAIATNSEDCAAGQSTSTAVGNVDNGTAITADLSAEVASGLVGIASEGDSAIMRLNACIESYNAVRSACNGGY